jgi:predicted aspartyl protease
MPRHQLYNPGRNSKVVSKVISTIGTFHAKCKIENPADRSRSVVIPKLLVDTGSEFTRAPERMVERIGIRREKKDVKFILANGQEVTRSVGFAIIRLDKYFTIDEVVFAEPGDLALLGARTLEGPNLTSQAKACCLRTSTRCVANTIKAVFALAKIQTPLAPLSLIDGAGRWPLCQEFHAKPIAIEFQTFIQIVDSDHRADDFHLFLPFR